MSVNRNVTVPDGRAGSTPPALHPIYRRTTAMLGRHGRRRPALHQTASLIRRDQRTPRLEPIEPQAASTLLSLFGAGTTNPFRRRTR